MPHIATDSSLLTPINVFSVAPADQQRLVELLVQATNEVMKDLPGFVSASIHRSDDGARVVNYAQWRRREDFEAMLKNPAAQQHMRAVTAIARPDPRLYEVCETIEAAVPSGAGRVGG